MYVPSFARLVGRMPLIFGIVIHVNEESFIYFIGNVSKFLEATPMESKCEGLEGQLASLAL